MCSAGFASHFDAFWRLLAFNPGLMISLPAHQSYEGATTASHGHCSDMAGYDSSDRGDRQ
eukprot:SAG25_NODE_133_length_14402_cov_15.122142_2_plen_60_part_00